VSALQLAAFIARSPDALKAGLSPLDGAFAVTEPQTRALIHPAVGRIHLGRCDACASGDVDYLMPDMNEVD